jgi:membrane protein DedA with SNARE-associated domain
MHSSFRLSATIAALARLVVEGHVMIPLARRVLVYVMLGLTGIVAEEATPLLGGLAAQDGRLDFTAVVAAISVGTWVAAVLLYFVGRARGHWVRKRFPWLRTFFLRAFTVVRRHPWRATLAVRWVFGLRIALPIACGAARVPLGTYVIGSAVSCFTWSLTFVVVGWYFGEAARRLLHHVERYERWIVLVLALGALGGWWVARARRRKLEQRAVKVIAGHDEPPPERKGL